MSLVAASIIVGLITAIIKTKGSGAPIIRLVAGIFLSLVMLTPIFKLELQDVWDFYNEVSFDASTVVNEGKNIAQDEMHTIIKENLEAYILDKASALQLDVDVEVHLTEALPPAPNSITIEGDVSPYNKKIFQTFLSDEIGISKEQQIWQ